MKIEKLEELKEKAIKVIQELTENRIASLDYNIDEEKRYFFEVESGTEKEKGDGGTTFLSFEEALNYTLKQIKEQIDTDIQECEDFEWENWYQINLFTDGYDVLFGFNRVSETEFEATKVFGFSGTSILDIY